MFVEKGVVVEDGTHNQLMALKGRYHEVITAGNLSGDGWVENTATVAAAAQKRFSMDSIDFEGGFRRKSLKDDSDSDAADGETIPYGKVFGRILRLVRFDWCSIVVATVSAILIGLSEPIFAILMAEFFGVSAAIQFALTLMLFKSVSV